MTYAVRLATFPAPRFRAPLVPRLFLVCVGSGCELSTILPFCRRYSLFVVGRGSFSLPFCRSFTPYLS